MGIADAEGLDALSMRRVAADLGVAPMSLYRHVPGKDELVALMVERALGEPPACRTGQDWRDALAGLGPAAAATDTCRHPWCAPGDRRAAPGRPARGRLDGVRRWPRWPARR